MAMTINTNITAMTAQRYLGINNSKSSSSLAKLSSGSRIPSAKYDAAGLAIGTKLNAEINSLKQASQNAAQAVSMLQIADGALATTADILTRMKSLAVQASSGQLADSERTLLNQEFVALRSEVDRIASDTAFNGTTLLNGGEVEATMSYASPGNLASNGVTVAVDASKTTDGDAFRISYDRVDSAAGTNDIGNLTVTNLRTGESETIDIFSAVDAVTDQTDDGSGGEDLDTNLSAGNTVDVQFASLGVTLTLDSQFNVDGFQFSGDEANFSVANGNLGTTYSGATAVNAAVTSAISNISVPDGTGGLANLDVSALADLKELGATVYDETTGNLYLAIDEDSTNGDFDLSATTGLEYSIDGGNNWAANYDNNAEGSALNVLVRLDGSGTNASNAVVASFTVDAHTQAVDNAGSTLGITIGNGLVGVTETAGTTKSFSYKVGTGTISGTDTISITLGAATTSALSIGSNTITSSALADASITALDSAITTVSTRRADIGASQSRLDFAAASVAVALENTSAANSAIMDADVSQEMTEFTSKQVLLQAGISMLAQANQQPALLLSLLQ